MNLRQITYTALMTLVVALSASQSHARKHISIGDAAHESRANGQFISITPREARPFPNFYIIRTTDVYPHLISLPQTAATTVQGVAVDIGLGCSETRIMGLVVHGACNRFVWLPKVGGYTPIEMPPAMVMAQAETFGHSLRDPRSYELSRWHSDAPWILSLGLFSYLLVTSRIRNIRLRRRARYRGALPYHLKYARKGHQIQY